MSKLITCGTCGKRIQAHALSLHAIQHLTDDMHAVRVEVMTGSK